MHTLAASDWVLTVACIDMDSITSREFKESGAIDLLVECTPLWNDDLDNNAANDS